MTELYSHTHTHVSLTQFLIPSNDFIKGTNMVIIWHIKKQSDWAKQVKTEAIHINSKMG